MKDKGILNELRKVMDEIKQKPLSKPEFYMMSWNEKYQLDNKLLCLQAENAKLKKVIKFLKDELGLYLEKVKFDRRKIFALMSKLLGMCLLNTTEENYDLLKEVFGND